MALLEDVATAKILLVGDSGVGKSSILLRYTDDVFQSLQPTIGVDFRVKTLTVGGRNVKMTIWDTAGQERFRTLTSAYYRGAHGVILVYDVSKRESFESVRDVWLQEVRIRFDAALLKYLTNIPNQVSMYCTRKSAVKVLVGNKVDVEDRLVTTEEGEELAREGGAIFVELSAKTASGVHETFQKLVTKILDTPDLLASADQLNGSIRPGEASSSYSDYCAC